MCTQFCLGTYKIFKYLINLNLDIGLSYDITNLYYTYINYKKKPKIIRVN